jgi:hypothetical protein
MTDKIGHQMLQKAKSFGSILLGLAIFIALLALLLVFIKGALWASTHLLYPLYNIGWVAIALVFLLLLPLSLFRRLRPFTGTAIFLSSYVFGLICWLTGFVVTYALWGGWAVILGIVFMGGGVVPIGVVASLFKSEWPMFAQLLALAVLTLGTRVGGIAIAESDT